MWLYSERKSEVASVTGRKVRSLASISLCNRTDVSGVLQIVKSTVFPRHKILGFHDLGKGAALCLDGQYLHDKSWPFAAGESETMQLHKRAVKRESRTSAGTVEAERFRLLNRFSFSSVLPTTAASFDADKSLLCLLSKYKSTLYILPLIYLSGGA